MDFCTRLSCRGVNGIIQHLVPDLNSSSILLLILIVSALGGVLIMMRYYISEVSELISGDFLIGEGK